METRVTHLRLAFEREGGSIPATIDLPQSQKAIHIHVHLDGVERSARPPVHTGGSGWRSFGIAFALVAALGGAYALGSTIGTHRALPARDEPLALAEPTPMIAPPSDPLAAVREQLAKRPVVTPPPGSTSPNDTSAPANPFGLHP
jgi:hypothetical protein